MSAFMVSDETLIALAIEADRRKVIPSIVSSSTDLLERVNDVVSSLWAANVASLRARYGARAEDMISECPVVDFATLRTARKRESGEIAKRLACYEYQACEADTWEESPAHRLCRWLTGALLRDLPGYEPAPWE